MSEVDGDLCRQNGNPSIFHYTNNIHVNFTIIFSVL